MKSFIEMEVLKEAYLTTLDIGVREDIDFTEYSKSVHNSYEVLDKLGRTKNFLRLLEFGNAIANEIRLKILHYIYENKKTCFCELENLFGIKKSTLNYHVKMLVRATLLKSSKKGKLVILELGDSFSELIPDPLMDSFKNMSSI